MRLLGTPTRQYALLQCTAFTHGTILTERTQGNSSTGSLSVQFYDDDRDKYRSLLLAAVDSPITELRPKAARLMAALTLRDDWMLEQLLTTPIEEQKAGAITDKAVWMFKTGSYHTVGKRILLHLIDHKEGLHNATRLLSNHALKLEEDKDILEKLIFSGDAPTLNRALRYFYETEGCITDHVPIYRCIYSYAKYKLLFRIGSPGKIYGTRFPTGQGGRTDSPCVPRHMGRSVQVIPAGNESAFRNGAISLLPMAVSALASLLHLRSAFLFLGLFIFSQDFSHPSVKSTRSEGSSRR